MLAPLPVSLASIVGVVEVKIDWLAKLLCCPVVTALQFQGALVALAVCGGWLWAGSMRLRELRRLQKLQQRQLWSKSQDASSRLAQQDKSLQSQAADIPIPKVTLILPVKGLRDGSIQAWASHLSQQYGGDLEAVFVVDDRSDPAHAAAEAALRHSKGQAGRRCPIELPVPGQKSPVSAGIKAASSNSKYVLCLDDDVTLHPTAVSMLVAAAEDDPGAFMVTGYPFDIPPENVDLLTLCMLVYHLPLLIAFSVRQQTDFLYGGCMMFPLEPLQSGQYPFIQAWQDGGYSDDLTAASVCNQHGLQILCPSSAIFPQHLQGPTTIGQWWNYLRRQLYVLDTYASDKNRRTNHTMMLLHSWLSWGLVLPMTTVMLRSLLWLVQVVLLPTQSVWQGPGTSYAWLHMFHVESCPWSSISHATFALSFLLAACSLSWMTGVVLRLLQHLHHGHVTHFHKDRFPWGKVWLAMYVNNAVLPLCMLYTYVQPAVEWSGVTYRKHAGRVVRQASRHPERCGQALS
ncbi:hypothetical protein WJX84_002864 [Apatococcus fuscideae]|uniref:ceramide glucosyltransferase n=1 Tax=Apatococcus fuscideae TaxID=2026836 RepID=A0AAW1T2X9_9CHLO